MKEIVFVCTGNTCRSPMAEGLLQSVIPSFWKDEVRVSSAGIGAWEGQAAAGHAVAVLAEIGVDISRHRARMLTREIVENAALLVAMAREHRDYALALAPGAAGRVLLIGELDPGRSDPDVRDPMGEGEEGYRRVRDDIDTLVGLLAPHLAERFGLTGLAGDP
jgi:protein-tyrosine-phosphatase